MKKIKIEICNKYYHPTDCTMQSNKLFIFGDNTEKVGRGGQACIRPCSNTIGIATKLSCGEFMNDDNFITNKMWIDNDIVNILKKSNFPGYTTIVFPFSGIGTGLANMQQKCPKTFLYLSTILLEQFGFNNLNDLVNNR